MWFGFPSLPLLVASLSTHIPVTVLYIFLVYLNIKINFITLVADDGTDDGDDDSDWGSVGRQDGQNAGRKLSAKTIKAILELICDEAVSFS